jgi:hypothetical protein
MRVYSDDHGLTWSPAALVHASTKTAQSSQPMFLPDGKLAIVYWNYNGTSSRVTISWKSSSQTTAEIHSARSAGSSRASSMESSADSRRLYHSLGHRGSRNGNIYVAYQARLTNGAPRIAFTRSSDAGATWSSPIAVSDGNQHGGPFNPAIASSPDGQTLTVVYYSNRDNLSTFTLVDVYLAQSFDGGETWQPNIRLTPVSTDATLSPLTPAGHMLGDYIGIAESTSPNVPAVADLDRQPHRQPGSVHRPRGRCAAGGFHELAGIAALVSPDQRSAIRRPLRAMRIAMASRTRSSSNTAPSLTTPPPSSTPAVS